MSVLRSSFSLGIVLLALIVIGFSSQAIMGNLYNKVLISEIANVKSQHQGPDANKVIDGVEESLKGMLDWDSGNPDYLINASYISYLLSKVAPTETEQHEFLDQAIYYLDLSIQQRPLYPDAYIQKADLLGYRGDDISKVYEVLEKAYRFGQYEKGTAEVSIKRLFAHWEQLTNKQKMVALRFITHHDEFGIPDWRLNEIIKFSPQKEQLCNVAVLSDVRLWTCGNYKSNK